MAIAMGVVGAALVVTAFGFVLFTDETLTTPAIGLAVRVGAVLVAASLALPSVRKPSLPAMLIAGAVLVLVLLRPSLIWVGLAAWITWLVRSRQRARAEARDS